MQKIVPLLIITLSLFALANAALVYQRSYYLESGDRVDLQRLTDRVEQLERKKLVDLSRRLVTISQSDFGILKIMNNEFRRALLYVMICLGASVGWMLYQILRTVLRRL